MVLGMVLGDILVVLPGVALGEVLRVVLGVALEGLNKRWQTRLQYCTMHHLQRIRSLNCTKR